MQKERKAPSLFSQRSCGEKGKTILEPTQSSSGDPSSNLCTLLCTLSKAEKGSILQTSKSSCWQSKRQDFTCETCTMVLAPREANHPCPSIASRLNAGSIMNTKPIAATSSATGEWALASRTCWLCAPVWTIASMFHVCARAFEIHERRAVNTISFFLQPIWKSSHCSDCRRCNFGSAGSRIGQMLQREQVSESCFDKMTSRRLWKWKQKQNYES